MPLYESTFITRHDMSAQQVEGLTGNFTNIIKENGGEVTKTEYWGLRNLAYRIKKNRKGHYVFFNIDAPFETMRELERNLRLNEDVLRYLTVAVDELDPNPSPIMQARAARDERSRRGGGAFPKARGDSAEKAKPKPDSTDEAAAAPAPAKESKTASAPAEQPAPAPAKESKAASAPADQPAPAPAKESKAASAPADQPAPASAKKSKAASAPAKK